MKKFTGKVLEYIREENLIPAGSTVIAGFSGGADSLCLVCVLMELKQLLKLDVRAVHVHHGLRGEEADRDAEFVRQFCLSRGIPFTVYHAPVREYASEHGLSLEEAGRILRYSYLEEEAGKYGGLVAAAHHADDQAETILMNLVRGSGLKGMGGMQPARGRIIRPLLAVSKKDILKYLKSEGLDYVTDSTNLENDFTRNRIRNVIIPEFEKGVNLRASEHIVSTGRMISQADSYLEDQAKAFLTEQGAACEPMCSQEGTRISLPRGILKEKPQILRRYVIIEALRRLEVPLKDWGEKQFRDIDRAVLGRRGHHVDLPGNVYAVNTGHMTDIIKESEKAIREG